MVSTIDPTLPASGQATTASVRLNFQRAKNEIEALQSFRPMTPNLHDWIPPGLTGVFHGEGTDIINGPWPVPPTFPITSDIPNSGYWRYMATASSDGRCRIEAITEEGQVHPSYCVNQIRLEKRRSATGVWSNWAGQWADGWFLVEMQVLDGWDDGATGPGAEGPGEFFRLAGIRTPAYKGEPCRVWVQFLGGRTWGPNVRFDRNDSWNIQLGNNNWPPSQWFSIGASLYCAENDLQNNLTVWFDSGSQLFGDIAPGLAYMHRVPSPFSFWQTRLIGNNVPQNVYYTPIVRRWVTVPSPRFGRYWG